MLIFVRVRAQSGLTGVGGRGGRPGTQKGKDFLYEPLSFIPPRTGLPRTPKGWNMKGSNAQQSFEKAMAVAKWQVPQHWALASSTEALNPNPNPNPNRSLPPIPDPLTSPLRRFPHRPR